MTTAPFLNDLTRVRGRTRKHSAEGVAAAEAVERRATVLRLLNDILASELIWLMRYRRRYLLRGGKPEIGEERFGTEPASVDRLAQRIVELGGEPDLDPDNLLSRTRAEYAARGSMSERIREDLRAERIVIDTYTEVLGFIGAADPPTRAMLESNLGQERARVAQLSQILRDLEVQAPDSAR